MTELLSKRLRHNEYYGVQPMLDQLYAESKQGRYFTKLYDFIISEENILLAYRNIKANTGSKTKGTNGHTIQHIAKMNKNQLIRIMRRRLKDYEPDAVRRVYIPKPNGDKRPLGIPTIEDRLIQQAFLQILEPICEAKFHHSSFGFRPSRSTHQAIARCQHLINHTYNHYVVDVDIKGFFDNVNHGKLLKQLWTMGIRDKRVLSIISKMLKAEIAGEGIPVKGTPQGGILSPLLANVVLNELDWWISNQWETKPTKYPYKEKKHRINAIHKTKLKPCFIVRYADDFKIFTDSYANAKKLMIATENWLKERLGLEISKEKSKIVNLRKNGSDFLGIRLRADQKETSRKGYVAKSKMSPKSKQKVLKVFLHKLTQIRRSPTPDKILDLNTFTLGVHNYYKPATDIAQDFNDIRHLIHGKIKTLLYRNIFSQKGEVNPVIEKFYAGYKHPLLRSCNVTLYPIEYAHFKKPTQKHPEDTVYTINGREKVHNTLQYVSPAELKELRRGVLKSRSVQYADNRISRYVGQNGKCYITKQRLLPSDVVCHHKIPLEMGGTDDYENLVIIHKDVHWLIHTSDVAKVRPQVQDWDNASIKKLNTLRVLAGYSAM